MRITVFSDGVPRREAPQSAPGRREWLLWEAPLADPGVSLVGSRQEQRPAAGKIAWSNMTPSWENSWEKQNLRGLILPTLLQTGLLHTALQTHSTESH